MPDLWMDVDVNLAEVPVNIFPLIDDTDFKTREVGITYDQAGMDLVWNFVTPAGAMTQTAVTPTTAGNYDWAHQGDGMYTIEIIATGGASINNDTEGFGWFTGICTGVLPWRGPVIGFRAAGLNDKMVESAYDTTRGLAGTALPAAAADAAGGLPISDAGGLDLDSQIKTDIDDILTDTAVIGALGAGLTAIPWNAAWDAEVESEAQDALVADNLDHLCKTATAAADMTTEVADNTILSRVLANGDTSVFDPATDGLTLIHDDVATLTTTVGAAGAGLTEAGGTGDQLTAMPWNAAWDAEVQSEVADELDAAHAEPSGAPAANESMRDKAGYLFMALRNKIHTDADSIDFYDDAGNVEWSKATSDDGTDYNELEGA